jgi:glutaconate CoA-transferase subunit B
MTNLKDPAAPAEVIACVLSRHFIDEEIAALGAASQLAMAAVKLAQRMHAPNLSWMSGGSGAINSQLPLLLESAADYRNLFGAEYRYSMEDAVDLQMRGRLNTGLLGGLQVDKFGNLNLVCVGDYNHPKMRGPGSVGLPFAAAFGRLFIYLQHHDPRVLVEKVDFVSGPGHSPERSKWVIPGSKGPYLIATPLALFDFDSPDKSARLVSVHPGHTVEEVLSKTGFKPHLANPVLPTQPPSEEELRILRTEIDVHGVLRRLIGP